MNRESFLKQIGQFKKSAKGKVPNLYKSQQLLTDIISLLFPVLNTKDNDNIQTQFEKVCIDIEDNLISISYTQSEAENLCDRFIDKFNIIYNNLLADAKAIYEGDPAAESIEEVIVTYPGFYAICVYRIAHEIHNLKIPVLSRLFSEYAHKLTGIDIHPAAKIGKSFCIDHGTGIVIGETTIIGDNVKIYQGVTLGALSVDKTKAGRKRHPDIGNNVTIYAGATILGGKTIIGNNSVIGGNAWLTESIEPDSVVLNKSKVFVKSNNKYANAIDFVI